MANSRTRALLEFREINKESLKTVEEKIWLSMNDPVCWLLHDSSTWNSLVLVTAKGGTNFSRDIFHKGAPFKILKNAGLNGYQQVGENRIDKYLEEFIKRPNVVRINCGSDDQEEMFERVQGPQTGGLAALES